MHTAGRREKRCLTLYFSTLSAGKPSSGSGKHADYSCTVKQWRRQKDGKRWEWM